MDKVLSSLGVLLALAVVSTALAQDKPMPGHERMAKGKPASAASMVARATSAAPPDIGRGASVVAMVGGKMQELRKGSNGWLCMVDLVGDAMCLDKEWQGWGDAWMNKKDPPARQSVGVAYMLRGDKGASNTDPYATKRTADNQWVVSGPHIMILPVDAKQLDAYPTDWKQGGPWVMWKGTPYAHIMVPTTAMASGGKAAPAAK